MLKIIAVVVLSLITTTLRRSFRGPASPAWSWRLEWIVAAQRAALTAMIDWPPWRIREVMLGGIGATARTLEVIEETLGGVPCERSARPGTSPESHLLYLHGGGFALGSIASHRELVSTLVSKGGFCAHSVGYRQPPEDRFPAAVDDVVAAYRGLLDSGIGPERIAIAGDSAGGNLCLALLLRAKAEGLPMPASAVLICPAPDLALPGASWHREPYLDYLTRPLAQSWLVHYLDPEEYENPIASPIKGDLQGLPPILMHAGGNEGLLDEIEILADRLRKADIALTYRCVPEMPHVWHIFAGLLPEADESLEEIATFVAGTTSESAPTHVGESGDRVRAVAP